MSNNDWGHEDATLILGAEDLISNLEMRVLSTFSLLLMPHVCY